MSLSTPLCTLLKEGAIVDFLVEKAATKALSVFQARFTFTAFEIANAYQKSYSYALAAICAGLATPDQKFSFLQKLAHSKVEREFAGQIEQDYLQPFAIGRDVQDVSALRQQLIGQIKALLKSEPIFSAENRRLTDSELTAFINYKGGLAITDLILAELDGCDETLSAFFRFEDLLGNATLFFLHGILCSDTRTKDTIAALQREGLFLEMRELESSQEELTKRLQHQLDEQNANAMQALQAGNFAQASQITSQLEHLQKTIKELPQRLDATQAAWQSTHQHWLAFSERFQHWAGLLNSQLNQVLAETETLHWEIEAVHEDDKVLELLKQLMARFDLSVRIKANDEFTHHNSTSLKLIEAAVAELKALPFPHPSMVIMAGSLLSSTGDIAQAENLFVQARDQARNKAEKALACFNLFQVRLRKQAYTQALADLQTAIDIDRHYALHDIDKYPIVQLLGAGGMGCVFLCHDQWGEKKVVVKCFWEGRKGKHQEVFGEAMIMRQVAGAYVPTPLDCGYVDAHRQAHPYFVTEYIEGALDGEAWLAKYGKFEVLTGIAVGIEIAKGLQMAHDKGIFHLDLKPANLLFEQRLTGFRVRIVDFGLARVATSRQSGLTQFGQTIVGTLLYAPPEQIGEGGKLGAKSDLYAFGVTLYRLMTGEKPRSLNPRRLAEAPSALFDLLCHCKEENPDLRPATAGEVVKRLENILVSATIVVSATGKCQSISAAIKKAKAGSRILVKAGVYQEELFIDKPLEIIGDGEVVVESKNADCIFMKTDYALVRGLSLHNRAQGYYAVDIPQGQLSLEHCDITSDTLACVGIHGCEAVGILSHCQIHDGKRSGVFVNDEGTGRIENCDIFGNALAGIQVRMGGNSVVKDCQIHDGKGSGVFVYEKGTGRIENCDIFGNANAGIEIKTGGYPVVKDCQIHDGKQAGVFVNEEGTGRIENCDIFGNAYAGIQISEGGYPVVKDCQIHDGKQAGVFVFEGGTGRIENCDIFGNAYAGIQISEGGNPVVKDCQVHDGEGSGVFVYEEGSGRLENCDIFGNAKRGIAIQTGGNPVVKGCQIHDGKGSGVFVYEEGSGRLENCDIFGNAYSGIQIKTGGNPVVKDCEIHDGKQDGVFVYENGSGRLKNCDIFGNALSGIKIIEGGNPVIQKCTIKQNGCKAVSVYKNGAGRIEDCDLRDNVKGAWGIRWFCKVRRGGNKE
ncbi:MAG: right-handed parallel beta-helix repeat-containing protein [Pseudomonadota bacterium]